MALGQILSGSITQELVGLKNFNAIFELLTQFIALAQFEYLLHFFPLLKTFQGSPALHIVLVDIKPQESGEGIIMIFFKPPHGLPEIWLH